MVCDLWFCIVERFAAVYGSPLPKRVLRLGSATDGWGVELNATGVDVGKTLPAYGAAISWGGFPAGIVDPNGGVIAAGSAANEATFREWLETAKEVSE